MLNFGLELGPLILPSRHLTSLCIEFLNFTLDGVDGLQIFCFLNDGPEDNGYIVIAFGRTLEVGLFLELVSLVGEFTGFFKGLFDFLLGGDVHSLEK